MAAKKTLYKSVEFRFTARVTLGRSKQSGIQASDSLRLVRVTDEDRDDLFIDGSGVARGTEVPWSNVASAVRLLDEKEAPAK